MAKVLDVYFVTENGHPPTGKSQDAAINGLLTPKEKREYKVYSFAGEKYNNKELLFKDIKDRGNKAYIVLVEMLPGMTQAHLSLFDGSEFERFMLEKRGSETTHALLRRMRK